MNAAKHDYVGAGGGRLSRQSQRIADIVGHVLDLRDLVVVREDDRVACARQLADLAAHRWNVTGHAATRVLGGVSFEVQNFYRHVFMTSRLKSRAGAECVSAPTEMRSTPARAAATAPSKVMPPDASNFARPAVISTAFRMSSTSMLSRSTISALQSSASASCSSVSTSTSTGIAAFRARLIASRTPPAASMWLSLMRIASHRPSRWLWPPPARTAARSRKRSPGVVFRVSSNVVRG